MPACHRRKGSTGSTSGALVKLLARGDKRPSRVGKSGVAGQGTVAVWAPKAPLFPPHRLVLHPSMIPLPTCAKDVIINENKRPFLRHDDCTRPMHKSEPG